MIQKIIMMFTLALVFNVGHAQNEAKYLDEKWDMMLSKSNNYQNYKVIKHSDLKDIWNNVQDTVKKFKTDLYQERKEIATQKDQIAALGKKVEELKNSLEQVNKDKDTMVFMGANVDKYGYAGFLWFVIAALGVGILVFFFLFNKSNRIANQKISDYENLFNSFEDHKKGSLERERKLKRDLQTQINLNEELKNSNRRV
jgi:uncharacterized protein HemX